MGTNENAVLTAAEAATVTTPGTHSPQHQQQQLQRLPMSPSSPRSPSSLFLNHTKHHQQRPGPPPPPPPHSPLQPSQVIQEVQPAAVPRMPSRSSPPQPHTQPHGQRRSSNSSSPNGDAEHLPSISRLALQHISHVGASTTTAPRLASRERVGTSGSSGNGSATSLSHRGRGTRSAAMRHLHGKGDVGSGSSGGVVGSAHSQRGEGSLSPRRWARHRRLSRSSSDEGRIAAAMEDHHEAASRPATTFSGLPVRSASLKRHGSGGNGDARHAQTPLTAAGRSSAPRPRRRRHSSSSASPSSAATTSPSSATSRRAASYHHHHQKGHLYRGHPAPLHATGDDAQQAPGVYGHFRPRTRGRAVKLPTLRTERLLKTASVEEDSDSLRDRFHERQQELQRTRQTRDSVTHAKHRLPQRYMMVGYRASLANRQQMSEEELLHLQRLAVAPAPELYFGKGISGTVPQLRRRHLERAQLRGRLSIQGTHMNGVVREHEEGAPLKEEEEHVEEEEEQEEKEEEEEEEEEEEQEEEESVQHHDDDDDDAHSAPSEMSQLLMAKEDGSEGTGLQFGRISMGWEGTDLDPAQAQLDQELEDVKEEEGEEGDVEKEGEEEGHRDDCDDGDGGAAQEDVNGDTGAEEDQGAGDIDGDGDDEKAERANDSESAPVGAAENGRNCDEDRVQEAVAQDTTEGAE
ncbi:hypothetical protein PTSG_00910 [Salpingoeca rosetta]|uniref:Uncharacterized protein n=1 Tax=Salpingoeca rosetta (strain ATCC 50818 / BSB-021) TaxID=946362 RepID=F2TXU6_SALR5|nr:uncharacterized protein PTSG_00910 [Salpingoeca rosetta]EGD76205.1 hypothetical protein PTSG_00910 [Salpingoeca rosetta]|eukprot:XP_004998380.1 hypothetical protein PTSG_00910 [Salpingoeca rosetta]